MVVKTILETERLRLREFNLDDVEFILALVNTATWLKFIGDKNVHSLKDAAQYLSNGPMKSYHENGFGLWHVRLKDSDKPIGMCGLVKRDYLAQADIGFALTPDYEGMGYGFEMGEATVKYAKEKLKISTLLAITDSNNKASINLLNKLGLRFEKNIQTPEYKTVLLFS